MASNVVLSTQEFDVVGTRPVRPDGVDKVTGRARYGADINLPGTLHAKVLRSPHPHARIISIDVSRALQLPGVKAVTTSADLPQRSGRLVDVGEGSMTNPKFMSNNCLAGEKVLYKGHAVAAVAATSTHIAEEALSLIDVKYETLPFVLDARSAMKEDAPVLHERLALGDAPNMRPGGLRNDDDPEKGSNIASHYAFDMGDLEKGFQEADVVIEREFTTVPVHQGYIEPHTATAHWGSDGNLTIWCSSQGHFVVRDNVAGALGIPVSKVKIVPMEIGGGFGGKIVPYLEPVAAVLSKKTGHPVKMTMSRTEVFEASGPTHGGYMKMKIGATKDGRIVAADGYLAFEAGCYPGSPIVGAANCMFTPYVIPNARADVYDVVVNKPKVAAYRAPGVPAGAFAVETILDEICEKLGMDPLEFRTLNGAKEGDRRLNGVRNGKISYLETVQAAKESDHYRAPLGGPNQGRGVSTGFWANGGGPASATASVNPDGTISLVEGSVDIGGNRAVLAMHVAQDLGIPVGEVKPTVGDTDSVGFTSLTGGSGAAFKSGWASYEAALDIKRQMVERAAKIWDVSVDDVEYGKGTISHKSDPELRLSFKQLAARLNGTGGPIVGRAQVVPPGVGPSFGCHIVDVEVDPETGKVDVLRYTVIQDAGKAVHPSYVEGQMQGGAVQGIGWALNEEYFYNDQGVMANSSFLDYRMPTSLDLPMIDTVIVEVANPGHPYGLRGVGEIPIVPPIAAIANAIYHAVGVRMNNLPMSPGKILQALWEKDQK